MCSWDRDWLDLVLGCVEVGLPGSTAIAGIFWVGVFGLCFRVREVSMECV